MSHSLRGLLILNKLCLIGESFALQLICYFTLWHFDNIHKVKVEDIRVLDNGDIRIFQQNLRKINDQLGEGSYYYISNKPFGGFTVKRILDQYVLKLGLKSMDFLFPQFSSNTGTLHVCRAAIGYGSARSELIRVLESLNLPIVSLHSARQLVSTSWCVSGDTESDLDFEFEVKHRLHENRIFVWLFWLDSNIVAKKSSLTSPCRLQPFVLLVSVCVMQTSWSLQLYKYSWSWRLQLMHVIWTNLWSMC